MADDPVIAFGFLIENMLDTADETTAPSQELADFIVIVIDDSRVQARFLRPDANVPANWQAHLYRYELDIDVTGMPILDADALFPEIGMGGGSVKASLP